MTIDIQILSAPPPVWLLTGSLAHAQVCRPWRTSEPLTFRWRCLHSFWHRQALHFWVGFKVVSDHLHWATVVLFLLPVANGRIFKCSQRVLGQLGGQMSPKTAWCRRRKTLKRRRGSILTLKRDCQGFDSWQIGALNQCVLWQAAGRILYMYSFDNSKTLPFNLPIAIIFLFPEGHSYSWRSPLIRFSSRAKLCDSARTTEAHVSSSICFFLLYYSFVFFLCLFFFIFFPTSYQYMHIAQYTSRPMYFCHLILDIFLTFSFFVSF